MSSTSSSGKSTFSILQVVQKYLQTHQKGSNHWAICPFHKDTSPSLSISPEKNIFKCFSCNIAGDAVSFVMRIENCSYIAAIKKITSILNLDIEKYLNKKENEFRKLHELNSVIAEIYNKCLFNKANEENLNYLTVKRGLDPKIINEYKIGYAPKEDILSSILTIHQKNEKTSWGESEIRKSGIFNYSQYGKKPYFQERIIFPICNKDGQIIAFSGRSLGDQTPKYLNIKSNEIFSKKNAIFNMQNIKKDEPIYIFEGFIDLLKCQQFGFSNGIACMGGTVNIEIFKTLEDFSKDIFLCLDNDEAGHNFTVNLAKSLVQNGFNVKVIDLLDTHHKDIDEYFKSDEENASNAMKNPICCFEWFQKKSKITNLTSLQTFLDSSIDFLFIDGKKLRPKINPDFAKEKINYLFSLYKNLQEYESSKYDSIIDNKIKEYEGFILGSVINTNKNFSEYPRQQSSVISKNINLPNTKNPFSLLAIKYQNLIVYAKEKWNQFNENFPWYIQIPEKYLNKSKETDLIIGVFENLSSKQPIDSEEIQKIIDTLSKDQEKPKSIFRMDDFFNKYYSFNQEYTEILIENIKKNKELPVEERWLGIDELKKFQSEITEKASMFFINSSFSKISSN